MPRRVPGLAHWPGRPQTASRRLRAPRRYARVALHLAESLPDDGVSGQKRRAASKAATASSGRRSRRHMSASSTASLRAVRVVFSALTNDCQRGLWSFRCQTGFGPTGPRLFEQRRTSRGLLEMRGRRESRAACQPTIARDTGEPRSSPMPLPNQFLERARRRRVIVSIQCENPVRLPCWHGGTRGFCPSGRRPTCRRGGTALTYPGRRARSSRPAGSVWVVAVVPGRRSWSSNFVSVPRRSGARPAARP